MSELLQIYLPASKIKKLALGKKVVVMSKGINYCLQPRKETLEEQVKFLKSQVYNLRYNLRKAKKGKV